MEGRPQLRGGLPRASWTGADLCMARKKERGSEEASPKRRRRSFAARRASSMSESGRWCKLIRCRGLCAMAAVHRSGLRRKRKVSNLLGLRWERNAASSRPVKLQRERGVRNPIRARS
eukprot:746410-Hanusia_phi.AAC.1